LILINHLPRGTRHRSTITTGEGQRRAKGKKKVGFQTPVINHLEMEDDRALVGLGTAADIEESQLEVHRADNETTENAAPTTRQPKRRFVGRRAADEAAAAKGTTEEGGSGAVQGIFGPTNNQKLQILLRCSSNSLAIQPQSLDEPRDSSTECPKKYPKTPTSRKPSPCYRPTTTSRSPRRYTACASPAPKRSRCRCRRVCSCLRRPFPTS
jgi:hypothetical protein